MFKNPKGIKNVDLSFDGFIKIIDKLSVGDIEDVFSQSSIKAISNLYELVKDDLERFIHRLKSSFSKEKCLVICVIHNTFYHIQQLSIELIF
jgi:hypothetical protein